MSDGGLAKSLTLDGGGELILSGSNSYSGGTVVDDGKLIVTSNSSLPDGGSLTVGAGGTFIFDPSMAGSSVVASTTAAVPEPGTLALLMAGLVVGFGIWRRKKGFASPSFHNCHSWAHTLGSGQTGSN